MKRTALLLTVIAASMLFASFAVSYDNDTGTATGRSGSGGTGVPDTGWYDTDATSFSINSADQLAGLAEIVNGTAAGIAKDGFKNKTITLTDDTDLSAYGTSFNDGKGWIHIGDKYANAFRGTFDGNGKKVTNLYINAADMADGYYVGLFGALLEGTIKDLAVAGADITGREYVGGIAGYISNGGTVANCYSSGTVAGRNYVGGIAGGNGVNSTLTNCYSSCDVDGYYAVGGITGKDSDTGRTSNCYSTGSVSGNDSVGGIAGIVTGGHVTECAALNPVVKGTDNVGRVAGLVNSGGTCTDNLAFAGMSKTPAKSGNNGTGIVSSNISADGTLGGRFTEDGGWTAENGRLPGLFGETTEIPDHIASWRPSPIDPYMVIAIVAVIIAIGAAVYLLRVRKKN